MEDILFRKIFFLSFLCRYWNQQAISGTIWSLFFFWAVLKDSVVYPVLNPSQIYKINLYSNDLIFLFLFIFLSIILRNTNHKEFPPVSCIRILPRKDFMKRMKLTSEALLSPVVQWCDRASQRPLSSQLWACTGGAKESWKWVLGICQSSGRANFQSFQLSSYSALNSVMG